VPEKSLYIVNTLSRALLHEATNETSFSSTETEQFMQAITAGLLANAEHLEAYYKAPATDRICSKLVCRSLKIKKKLLHMLLIFAELKYYQIYILYQRMANYRNQLVENLESTGDFRVILPSVLLCCYTKLTL